VREALGRGARLRVLTGDYLDITQSDALRRLLDWQDASAAEQDGEGAFVVAGVLEARVVETSSLGGRAFNPKAWHMAGPDFGVATDAPVCLPAPTALQQEALDALAASRAEARRRALIVMATGLGKTVLAALDIAAVAEEGRAPSVLWVAHRRELLEQAATTVRRGLPSARFAWMLGGSRPSEPFGSPYEVRLLLEAVPADGSAHPRRPLRTWERDLAHR
jgi:hypothetical protein